jgi:hypothetical protein
MNYEIPTGKPWLIRCDDEHGVLVAKDIYAVVVALEAVRSASKSQKVHRAVDGVRDLLEFAPVDVRKNGMIKWHGGKFAVERTTSQYPFDQ